MDNTVSSMTRHFSSELLSALYKTAGSMQVLGNPVGVFRAFRDGVRGFVSHTYTGVVGGRGIGTFLSLSLSLSTVFLHTHTHTYM